MLAHDPKPNNMMRQSMVGKDDEISGKRRSELSTTIKHRGVAASGQGASESIINTVFHNPVISG